MGEGSSSPLFSHMADAPSLGRLQHMAGHWLHAKDPRSTSTARQMKLFRHRFATLALFLAVTTGVSAQDLRALLQASLKAEAGTGEEIAALESASAVSPWDLAVDPSLLERTLLSFNRQFVPDPMPAFREGASASQAILTWSEKSKWGRRRFDAQEASDYRRATQLLFAEVPRGSGAFQRTVGYQRYLDLLAEYEALKREYDATPPDKQTAEMRARLSAARSKLVNEGQQPLYRGSESRLRQLLAYDYSMSILPSIRALAKSVNDSNGQPRIAATPAIRPRMAYSQWRTLTLEWLPGAQNQDGAPNKGAIQAIGQDGTITEIELPSKLVVSVDLTQISLVRPWLDLDLLARSAGKWVWNDPMLPPLSDGPEAQPPIFGLLSAIPVRLIYVRSISLTGNWSDLAEGALASAINSGSTLRLGPFVVFSPSSPGSPRPFFASPSTLSVPQAQLIGVSFMRPPRLPGSVLPEIVFDDPLPTFPFP